MQNSFEGLRTNRTPSAATKPTTANPRGNQLLVQVVNIGAAVETPRTGRRLQNMVTLPRFL